MSLAELLDQLADGFRAQGEVLVQWLPRLATGLLLAIVALAAAKAIEWIARSLLRRVGFDRLTTGLEIDGALDAAGIGWSPTWLVSRVVFFAVLILGIRTTADVLGLVAISEALGALLAYVPRLLAVILVVVVGGAAAQFVRRSIIRVGRDADIEFAKPLGNVVFTVLLFVIALTALGQAGIPTDSLWLVGAFVLGAFGLAFSLSFGLGTRDVTRNLVAGFYLRKVFEVGKEVEVGEHRGTLRAFTPTQLVIEQGEHIVAIPNSAVLDGAAKQRR